MKTGFINLLQSNMISCIIRKQVLLRPRDHIASINRDRKVKRKFVMYDYA